MNPVWIAAAAVLGLILLGVVVRDLGQNAQEQKRAKPWRTGGAGFGRLLKNRGKPFFRDLSPLAIKASRRG